MAATIKDVARLAGVTIGTVSRAFNAYTDIKPETKARIMKAADDLDYTPNVSARNLSSKKPPNIGLIISGLLEGDSRDNGVYLILQGVFEYATSARLEVALYTTNSKEQRRSSYAQFCRNHSISGAIISGITTDDVYLTELINSRIPSVVIDVPIFGNTAGWVSIDNSAAAKEMTEYLLAKGHHSILVVEGKENTAVNIARLSGVQQAFKQASLPFTSNSVVTCDFSEEMAYQKILAYFAVKGKEKATALMCFSDIMAFGAMRAVQEAGLCIPQDVSVTGFDDLPISEYISPTLSSVRQNMRQIGFEGASMLHQMLIQDTTGFHKILPHELILRRSSGPSLE